MATRKSSKIPPVSPNDAAKLVRSIDEVTANFRGQFDVLENAIGMLMIGRLVGWKVLLLIHNKRSIRKYEDILGIKIRDEFPEEGPFADKSNALRFAKSVGNFWKIVSGEVKIDGRRELSDV